MKTFVYMYCSACSLIRTFAGEMSHHLLSRHATLYFYSAIQVYGLYGILLGVCIGQTHNYNLGMSVSFPKQG